MSDFLNLASPELQLAIFFLGLIFTGTAFFFIAELSKSIMQHHRHRQVQRDLSDHAMREYDQKQLHAAVRRLVDADKARRPAVITQIEEQR